VLANDVRAELNGKGEVLANLTILPRLLEKQEGRSYCELLPLE